MIILFVQKKEATEGSQKAHGLKKMKKIYYMEKHSGLWQMIKLKGIGKYPLSALTIVGLLNH